MITQRVALWLAVSLVAFVISVLAASFWFIAQDNPDRYPADGAVQLDRETAARSTGIVRCRL